MVKEDLTSAQSDDRLRGTAMLDGRHAAFIGLADPLPDAVLLRADQAGTTAGFPSTCVPVLWVDHLDDLSGQESADLFADNAGLRHVAFPCSSTTALQQAGNRLAVIEARAGLADHSLKLVAAIASSLDLVRRPWTHGRLVALLWDPATCRTGIEPELVQLAAREADVPVLRWIDDDPAWQSSLKGFSGGITSHADRLPLIHEALSNKDATG